MEQTPQTPYKFSSEELRVLQQCNSESFLHRSVPFGTLFGVAAYYGVKGGLLQPNSRYGAIPKVVGSVLLGYILGKISYQGKCAEKLMALPDSKLGAMLRNRRRRGGYQESLGMDGPGINVSSVSESETFTDLAPSHLPTSSSHMNIDVDRPLSAGLDDSFRPSVDDSHLDFYDQSLPPPSSSTTTYDELRRKNREEYELKKTKPFRGVLTLDEVPGALKSKETKMETSPSPGPPVWNKATNQYGDIWEK